MKSKMKIFGCVIALLFLGVGIMNVESIAPNYTCQAGMTSVADFCIEAEPSSSTGDWREHVLRCGEEGKRVCANSELYLAWHELQAYGNHTTTCPEELIAGGAQVYALGATTDAPYCEYVSVNIHSLSTIGNAVCCSDPFYNEDI